MVLQLYIYKCGNCGNTFKSAELPDGTYGEFLMRSISGEIVYLSSFNDIVFQEVEDFFENNKLLSHLDKISRAKIFIKLFGKVCDCALDKSEYQIERNPICPKCETNDKLSWHPTNPPELIDMKVDAVTHNYWHTLDRDKKEKILNSAIQLFLQKNL